MPPSQLISTTAHHTQSNMNINYSTAPTLSNSSTASVCPEQQARWRGVHPGLSLDVATVTERETIRFLQYLLDIHPLPQLTSAVDVDKAALVNSGLEEPVNIRTPSLSGTEEKLTLHCVGFHHQFFPLAACCAH